MKKLLLSIVVLFMGISVAFAQKTLSGNVVDDQGIPLPGATVLEQGTTNGVSTDFDYIYSSNPRIPYNLHTHTLSLHYTYNLPLLPAPAWIKYLTLRCTFLLSCSVVVVLM